MPAQLPRRRPIVLLVAAALLVSRTVSAQPGEGPHIFAGANVVAAVGWNWGPHHPVAQHSLRTAFLLQADSPSEAVVNTGPGWKLLRDSAYDEVRVSYDDVRAYYAAAQGERVDGA